MAPIWVDGSGANRILIAPGANDAVDGGAVTQGFVDRDGVAVVLAQLETPQSASAEAFRLARQRGAVTILNPAPAAAIDESLLAVTDWLIPNESEYELLFGRPPDPDDIAAEAADRPYGLVVTLGAAGAIVSDRSATSVVSAPSAADVVDTTGAGDAFVGAFAAGVGRRTRSRRRSSTRLRRRLARGARRRDPAFVSLTSRRGGRAQHHQRKEGT